jgi:hypothetical protein
MKRILRLLLAGAVGSIISLGTGAPAFAADSHEAVVGTWTLNVAKSTYDPGPAPKALTRIYKETPDGMMVTLVGTGADGSPVKQESTFKYDGKDYPYKGGPNFDSLSLERTDASTVTSTQKRGGKVVGTTIRTISPDGKTLTLTSTGTTPKGVAFKEVAVYDRK